MYELKLLACILIFNCLSSPSLFALEFFFLCILRRWRSPCLCTRIINLSHSTSALSAIFFLSILVDCLQLCNRSIDLNIQSALELLLFKHKQSCLSSLKFSWNWRYLCHRTFPPPHELITLLLTRFLCLAGYSITWNNKKINVFRSDVVCTNGIIHVIDRPLIEESDIRVSYASAAEVVHATLLPSLIAFVVAKLFM